MDYTSLVKNNAKGIDYDSLRVVINRHLSDDTGGRLYDSAQRMVNKAKTESDETATDTSAVFDNGIQFEDDSEEETKKDYLLDVYMEYVHFLFSVENFEEKSQENWLYKIFEEDYQIISQNEVLKNPKSMKAVFEQPDFNRLNYRPVFKQDDNIASRFTFIGRNLESIINQNWEGTEVRIYLSPDVKYIPEITEKIIEEQKKAHLYCLMKVCTDENYNDRIIMYVSKENFEKFLNMVNAVVKDHPEYFSEKNKNPLWGSINGYDNIYYGESPVDLHQSFGTNRSDAMNSALLATLNNDLSSTEELSDEEFERFKGNFRIACLAYNINPDNLAQNLSDKTKFEVGDGNTCIAINPIYTDYENKKFAVVYDVLDGAADDRQKEMPIIDNHYQEAYPKEAIIYIDEEELLGLYSNNPEVKASIINRLAEQERKNKLEAESNNRNSFIDQLSNYVNNPDELGFRDVEMSQQTPLIDDKAKGVELSTIQHELAKLYSDYCRMLLQELLLHKTFEKDKIYQQLCDIFQQYEECQRALGGSAIPILETPAAFIEKTAYLCEKYNVSYEDLRISDEVAREFNNSGETK